MTVTHPPIVVAEFTVYCDRGDHQVTVITDGARVASAGNGLLTRGERGVTRIGTRFIVPCPCWARDEECDGIVTVDQSDHTAWRAATPVDAAWLDSDAQTVDDES